MTTVDSAQIYLRPLEESDVTKRYLAWFQDQQVTRFLESKNLSKDDVIEHLRKGRESGKYHLYGVIMKQTNAPDTHVGNVKIGAIDNLHGVSGLSTLIGDRTVWGKGIGTQAVKLGTGLAFEKYRIRKMSSGIYGENIASIKAYTNAGWVIEGRLAGHYVVDGQTRDAVLVSCFNDKYFELQNGQYVAIP